MAGKKDVQNLRAVAEAAALAGGAHIRNQFLENPYFILEVQEKKKDDPVTNLDVESEALVREVITTHYPSARVVGEEAGVQGSGKDLVWFVDPLDGTGAFVRRNLAFVTTTVVVADLRSREVLAGAVYNPFLQLMYSAGRGLKATINGKMTHPLRSPTLSKARLLVDFSEDHPSGLRNALGTADVTGKVGRILRYDGSIAQHFCMVTQESLHGAMFWGTGSKGNFWDIGAAALICEEAGLKVTDLRGQPITFDSKVMDQVVVAPPALHKELLEWVAELAIYSTPDLLNEEEMVLRFIQTLPHKVQSRHVRRHFPNWSLAKTSRVLKALTEKGLVRRTGSWYSLG